jgi:hypothetical protein
MRFSGGVEDGDCPLAIKLYFEDPVRRIKRGFRALGHHWRDEPRLYFCHGLKTNLVLLLQGKNRWLDFNRPDLRISSQNLCLV